MGFLRGVSAQKAARLTSILNIFLLATSPSILVAAESTTPAVGLLGLGLSLYDPLCATTCHNILSRPELACSIPNESGGHGPGRHSPASGRRPDAYITMPHCHATDTSYLTSLAYCLDKHCGEGGDGLPVWEIEKFWGEKIVPGGHAPKWTYGEALVEAVEALGGENPEAWVEGVLNFTGTADEGRYEIVYGSFETYEFAEMRHSHYGLVILLVGAGIPILTTIVRALPFTSSLTSKLSPYLWSSIYKDYHMRTLPYSLGNPTTVGQALYVFLFFALNVVLSAIDYRVQWPHRMYRWDFVELCLHIANRTGVIAFAIAPLVILLSSRNSILLWATNWSHGTFMVLHRWVGRVFILQCVVHSIVEIYVFDRMGRYPEEERKPYWAWGIVATMAAVAIMFFGITWARRRHYEIFLITHIVLVIFVLIGSWYHVQLLYFGARGYENWLYAAFAVWIADRVAKVFSMSKTGVHTAKVTELSDELVRIDIEGVRWPHHPGTHGFVYFPGLSWRVWENHPFSVLPTGMIRLGDKRRSRGNRLAGGKGTSGTATPSSATGSNIDVSQAEKGVGTVNVSAAMTPRSEKGQREEVLGPMVTTSTGMTLYVRKFKGMTRLLKQSEKLTTLLEGPYNDRSHEDVVGCDRIVCIAGGVGITGVLPFAVTHTNAKLYWSVKERDGALIKDLEGVTNGGILDEGEAEVRIGHRFNVRELLEAESAGGWARVGVVVCGPDALCDEVRAVVSRLGRQRTDVAYRLAVEAFSW